MHILFFLLLPLPLQKLSFLISPCSVSSAISAIDASPLLFSFFFLSFFLIVHFCLDMPPSLADLLCCEDFSGCFSDNDVDNDDDDEEEEEEEEEERKRKRGYNLPSSSCSSISWRVSMAMVQPEEEEEEDDDDDDDDDEDIDIESTFTELVEREIFHVPCSDYLRKYEEKILDVESRQNAINWLFKVPKAFSFSLLLCSYLVFFSPASCLHF